MSAQREYVVPVPTGRKKALDARRSALDDSGALGLASQNTPSPERAKEASKWPVTKSGALLSFVTSGSRGWARYYNEAGPLFLRVGNLDHDSVSLDLRDIQRVKPPAGAEGTRTKVQASDILISVTADVGMVGLVPSGLGEAYINQHVALARPLPTVHPPFLAWCLASPLAQQQFRQLQRGATKVGLGLDDIRAVDVPLPPLPEQRRIVAEIEKQFTRLEAGVAALRRVQANLKRYRAAVLKAACEGRLVPTEAELHRQLKTKDSKFETGAELLSRILTERHQKWQGSGKYKEPAAADTANFQPLPYGWTWATAEQLTDENRSITYGVIKLGAPVHDGVHVLRSSDVRHLRLDLEGVKRIAPGIAGEYRRTFLKGGEVLITVRGTLGGVVVAPVDCAGFNISREVAMLAMVKPAVAKTAAIFIGSAPLQRWLLQRAKGIAYTGINIETLKELPLPLPPLAEQTRIVAEVERRLSVLDELEAVTSANLKRATRLRQSILQNAFTGNF